MRSLTAILVVTLLVLSWWPALAAEPIKVGIIGMDAHALPWTQIINNPNAPPEIAAMRIVAGFPGGSTDIPTSQQILAGSVEPCRKLGVEIVDSIDQLLAKVDAVMILSIDGRTHLPYAKKVFASGKPVFIDKPLAASLADAEEIYRLAKQHSVPCFSSSALRFAPGTQAVLTDPKVGPILGCNAFSPCSLEPHHPDLSWYGIHGVEILCTIMGQGCQSVSRTKTDDADVVVGVWKDGRIGTFRGTRKGPHTYGAKVFGTKSVVDAGKFEGYEPLIAQIAEFFKTGKPPVSPEQTLEIIAFIQAADASQHHGGCPVTLQSVFDAAHQ